MISQTAEYALRAVVWLASHEDVAQRTGEIAKAAQVPPGYLPKVMQMLGRAKIVKSQSGPRGGFRLVRPPRQLTVLDVINAIEPIERITKCPLELANHRGRLCPLHYRLDAARALIEDAYRSCTIASIVEEAPGAASLCVDLEVKP